MTKIELLNQIIEKKSATEKALRIERRKIEEAKADSLSRMYHKFFGEVLEEGDTTEVSGTYFYFKRPQEGYSYNKEILSLSFNTRDWNDTDADQICKSFYSTNDNSDFELRRMVLLGKVGQIILDFKDDIIAEFNSIKADFKDELSQKNKEIWAIEKEIKEHKNEIGTIEKNALLTKLETDGVEFQYDEDHLYRLPDLDVRFDWNIRCIRKLKVTNKTKSGKSADVEIETVSKHWDSDIKEYKLAFNTSTYDKVRMDKLNYIVSYYKDKITA